MSEKYLYDKESLKVDYTNIQQNKNNENRAVESKEESIIMTSLEKAANEEEMSNKEALMIIVMSLIIYAVISAVPTFVMMYFFGISFWISQLIVVVGLTLIVWIFGLYKPASEEQKIKSRTLLNRLK